MAASGCTALMTARGALIKPWIFKEDRHRPVWDTSPAEERLVLYRRYVDLAREHLGTERRAR